MTPQHLEGGAEGKYRAAGERRAATTPPKFKKQKSLKGRPAPPGFAPPLPLSLRLPSRSGDPREHNWDQTPTHRKDTYEEGMATHSSILAWRMDRGAWWTKVHQICWDPAIRIRNGEEP